MGPKAVKVMKQSPLNQLYPDAGWTVLFTKFGDLLRQDYDWSRNVAEIKSPVMLVFADADAVHTAHVMDIFALLGSGLQDAGLDGSGRPTAQLAVLPGMTHYNILSFPTLSTLVTRFLDALMSEAE